MKILILLIIGLIFAASILLIVVKMRGKRGVVEQPVLAPPLTAYPPGAQRSSVQANTKRCPTCSSTYTDETLRYCLMDGASLEYAVASTSPYDPGATIKFNDRGNDRLAPTIPSQPTQRAKECAPMLSTMTVPTPVLESPQSAGHEKHPTAYPGWYFVSLVTLSGLLVFIVGFAMLATLYTQSVVPLLIGIGMSLVVATIMVACKFVYRKRKRDT